MYRTRILGIMIFSLCPAAGALCPPKIPLIKIVNNSETVGRKKLMKTKNAYLDVLRLTHTSFLIRSTVSELTMILMIRGCISLVHPLILKIFDNSETVVRRKNL